MATPKSTETVKEPDYQLMIISSPAFSQNGLIPLQYTCDGRNQSPPLDIDTIPSGTKSLAIIMDDPDAPHGTWTHWVIWNIPVTQHIREGHTTGSQGVNDFNRHSYGGPCPPSGTHRYFFKVYALDDTLDLPVSADRTQLEKKLNDHVLGFGVLMGNYNR